MNQTIFFMGVMVPSKQKNNGERNVRKVVISIHIQRFQL